MKKLAPLGSGIALLAALALSPSARATPITVDLGASAQDYTLVGTGGIGGYGTYDNYQGACTTGATTTTCTLSGLYTGVYAGFTSGTYSLVTTFVNGSPLQSISYSPVGGPFENYFYISSFGTDTSVYLDLNDTSGSDYQIPIIVDSTQIPTSNYNLDDITETCGGTSLGGAPCTQINVGLVNGATYYGPVDGNSTFDSSTDVTPEPAPIVLLGTAMLSLFGYVALRRNRTASLSPNA